jgi:orotidine-5'-phosphate decarboxylase
MRDPKRRLAFALDYPTLDAARRGAEALGGAAGVLKIGLELFVREGPAAVRLGEQLGCEVFLDLKLHDIPETVERAVGSAASLGVRYLTLHAAGGPHMLERAARRAETSGLVLLAVTVLTSLDASDLTAVGVGLDPAAQALKLGKLAQGAGIPGLVCSPAEVGALRRALGPDIVLATPGIRLGGAGEDDQKRVATPASAIHAGASLLLVGRPIRDAPHPRAAALRIVDAIAEAERGRHD